MNHQYKILHVNRENCWITITSDDKFDREEPDAFVELLRKIQDHTGGTIKKVGDIQYRISGDGLDFIYQWDSLFGITVIYPRDVTEAQARGFLSRYMGEF